jgi:membrane associated rhomboid family serine protease
MLPRRRWIRTILALTPPVFVSVLVALAGLVLVRAVVPAATLRASNEEIGNYLQTLGTIYAVLLAFVVFVVWNQYNQTRELIEREANEVLDLFRTAKGFADAVRRPIQHQLRAYVEESLRHEWRAMAFGAEIHDQAGGPLDRLWDLLVRFEPVSQCHCALYEQMLDRYNDLSDVRASRVLASHTRIPLALRILLYTGAVMTVASTYLFAIDSFAVHAIVAGALAGAISHVIYLIGDLDQCFAGDWQVPRSAFERVRSYMERPDSETARA